MKNIYITLLLVTLCAVACEQPSRKKVKFPDVEQAMVQLLPDTSMMIGMPLAIERFKELLFISDFQGDSLVWVYNLDKHKVVQRLAPRGEGPDNFLSPVQMIIDGEQLLLHNRWHYTFREYALRQEGDTVHLINIGNIMHLPRNVDKICPIASERFIATGWTDKRYQLLNDKGVTVDSLGEYPSFLRGEKSAPTIAKCMKHQASLFYNRQKELLAVCSSHVLELLDCKPRVPKVINTILLSSYGYQWEGGGESTLNFEIGAANPEICATTRYIYIVYDPNTPKMSNESLEDEKLPWEIWIFDWTGKPIKRIITDKKIQCMYVNDDDSTAYCIVDAPNPRLAMLKIK
ncbi:MAG: TolB-like 6-bladed beta-propeller domain-containing protein [Mediterranea sp.]|jgi:hypothetical protein|nr:TolB-like 6-bladed beta-propeller domain-containing protein [Mediterranea sp.]